MSNLKEVIEPVLRAYCFGISVAVPEDAVNEIINSYNDLFLESD